MVKTFFALVLVFAMLLPTAVGLAEQEAVPLTVFVESHTAIIDFNDNRATDWAEQQCGIKLNFVVAPQDTGIEKMNLLLNSGNYPDIWLGNVPDENLYGIQTNVLMELTDVIEQYMPSLSSELALYPQIRDGMTALDGKLYTVPAYNLCVHCTYPAKMWYNTMQLESLGLDMPATADEFYQAMSKYKEANPDGIALAGNLDYIVPFVTNMFTYYPGGDYSLPSYVDAGLVLTDGKISSMLTSDGYRQALAYLKTLYDDQLLYEGVFTMDENQMRALIVSEGEPVLFTGSMHNVVYIDGTQTPDLYAHTRALTPLLGPDGRRYASYLAPQVTPGAAISASCARPDKAAQLLDLFYSTEGAMNMTFGEQGVNWDVADEGTISTDGLTPSYKRITPYTTEPNKLSWEPRGIIYWSLSMRQQGKSDPDFNLPTDGASMRAMITVDQYQPWYQDQIQTVPRLKFTAEENEMMSTLSVSLVSYLRQMRVSFITGAKDLDADWDAYVAALSNMGMEEFIGYHQTAYDRMNEA